MTSSHAEREPVPVRHLDELEKITHEYATLTSGGMGGWTMLGLAAWMAGAELLHRASPGWGSLAFLALAPLAVGLGLLEHRLGQARAPAVGLRVLGLCGRVAGALRPVHRRARAARSNGPRRIVGGAALAALLALVGLGFHRWQVRRLDRRMAALRGHLL
jgi:hypothetical protein